MSTESRPAGNLRPARVLGMLLLLLPGMARAATDWKFWPSAYLGVYRDGNIQVTGTKTSDTVARIGFGFDLSAENPPTSFQLKYTPYYEGYQDHGELDNLSHQLSLGLSHEISRRSNFHMGLSGWLTHSHPIQTLDPSSPTTLVPRTKELRGDLDFSGRFGLGPRSFLDWGAGAGVLNYAEDPAVTLQDQSSARASLGMGVELNPTSDVGARVGASYLDLELQDATDTAFLEAFYNHQFGRSLTMELSAGAVRAETDTNTSTDPKFGLDMTYTFQKGSTLSGGGSQDVSAGWGASSATLDRGAYLSVRPGTRTQRYQTNLTAYYWLREAVDRTLASQDIETVEALASFEWLPGRRHFALGAFYSYHDQNDIGGTNPSLETSYSSEGVFFRYTFRVEAGD